jgi:hypothetical protein
MAISFTTLYSTSLQGCPLAFPVFYPHGENNFIGTIGPFYAEKTVKIMQLCTKNYGTNGLNRPYVFEKLLHE